MNEPQLIDTGLNWLLRTTWHADMHGALKYEAEGKRCLYRPAVSRQACVLGESRSFLGRAFGVGGTDAGAFC